MLPIRWSIDALDDLDQLTDYIAGQDPHAALAMFEVIEKSVIPASVSPFLFRSGRVPGTREIVAHPNYIVVYRVFENLIEVVSVLHARQRYPFE